MKRFDFITIGAGVLAAVTAAALLLLLIQPSEPAAPAQPAQYSPIPVSSAAPSKNPADTAPSFVRTAAPAAAAVQKITPSPSALPTTASAPEPQTQSLNRVNVSVNGTSSFFVSVPKGATQCDVLNQAQFDGKISGLDLRYDANFETYAVYKINGTGKDSSVWWTYKVNGQSPNRGCSFIKANDGDFVEWKYIGS